MAFTFLDLVDEVKARATLDKASTEFDESIKNAVNTSLFRLSREGNWRTLRRVATFDTVTSYTTGSGAVSVTNDSKTVTVTGATFLTDGVRVGRRVKLGGSSKNYIIKTITSEETFTVDVVYDGTTSSTQTYEIYGQEEYTLPINSGRIYTLWHEDYGYPYVMSYISDIDFYSLNESLTDKNTPTCFRLWQTSTVLDQPKQSATLTIASSDSGDTSKSVTVYGLVGGYPDSETVATNASDGTTSVSTTKSFSYVDKVVKASSTAGRITVTSDSGNTTIAVLPAGDTAGGSEYKKVQIFPFPNRVFPINVLYYQEPVRMVNDSDVHIMGHEFDEAIILLATAKMNYSQSKKEGDKYFALYTDEVKNLKKDNIDKITNRFNRLRRTNMHNSRATRTGNRYLSYGQLGGYYGPRV